MAIIGRTVQPAQMFPARLFARLAHSQPPQDGARSRVEEASARAANDAFEVFVHVHDRIILNYLWRMLGDEQAAYDLTQETFLRAWEHFTQIQRYAQPRAWLLRVATNLALTQRRRSASPVGAAVTLEEETGPAFSDPARHVIESDLVRQILQELTPKRRAALVLREVYGQSPAEIADILGMTLDAVKIALYRAREQFRAIYAREDQP